MRTTIVLAQGNTRNADETIDLFLQALGKRRAYVRNRLKEIATTGREVQPQLTKSLWHGMLSELTTVECMLLEIRQGKIHSDELYNE